MKCKFDKSLDNLLGVNTWTYKGNPPITEEEYNSLEFLRLEGTKPSWSEVQNKVAELEQEEQSKANAKASAIAKLTALGLTEEEVKSIL